MRAAIVTATADADVLIGLLSNERFVLIVPAIALSHYSQK